MHTPVFPIVRLKGICFFRLSDGLNREHESFEVGCPQAFPSLKMSPAFYHVSGGEYDIADLLDIVVERIWLKRYESAIKSFVGDLSH